MYLAEDVFFILVSYLSWDNPCHNLSCLQWMEWHHLAHILLAGTTDGDTWMFKIPSGDTKTFQSHGVSSTVGKVVPDGR